MLGLVTTFNEKVDRVAMHAVRRELVEAQARAANVPLWPVFLPSPCSNAEYEVRMRDLVQRARKEGITHMAFGDLYLEDIRNYRIQMLAGSGVEPIFPLWCGPRQTAALARSMLRAGLRAVLTCVDPRQLEQRFAGCFYDEDLLAQLPPSVDPCGERGEFHTFCFAGPMFAEEIAIRKGVTLWRDGFLFTDVLSAS